MKVRKLTNISNHSVGIILESGTIINLQPGEWLDNVAVRDLGEASRFVRVEQDLSEIPERKTATGRTLLFD